MTSKISPVHPLTKQKTMHDYFRDDAKKRAGASGNASATFRHKCNHVFWYKFDQGFANPCCQVIGLVVTIFLFLGLASFLIGIGIDPLEVVGGIETNRNQSNIVVSAIVGESLWRTWTYIADPGTHADVNPTTYDRLLGAFIGIVGIILSAMVIGLIVDGIKKIMEDLERGRSRVTESNHFLVLGWTEKTVQVINQLALMMESENGGTIVIVSSRAKKEAEAELRERCELLTSYLVVRTGNMMAQSDLLKYSVHLARAIIVLAPDGAPDKADAQVLRTVLSIRGLNYTLRGHIVAEMRDIDNTSLVELVGGSHVETVVSHDIVGRLMIQSARSRGLADVFSSILGFENDEIYVKSWPEFTGQTFDTVLRSFDTCVPIGISCESDQLGQPDVVILNPPGTHVMRLSESVVVIAEDDDSYEPRTNGPMLDNHGSRRGGDGGSGGGGGGGRGRGGSNGLQATSTVLPQWKENKVVEKILMTGWRRDIDDVIVLLDELVSNGSELHMLNELTVEQRLLRLQDGGLDPSKDLNHLKLVHHVGNPAVRRQLKSIQLWKFDSVLILADEALEEDMMHSDSNSLAILLLVRDLQLKENSFHSRVIASDRRKSTHQMTQVMGVFQQSGLFGLPGSNTKKKNRKKNKNKEAKVRDVGKVGNVGKVGKVGEGKEIETTTNKDQTVVVAESGIAGLKTMKALYQKKKKGQQTQQQQPLTQPSPPPMPQPNALDMLDNSPPKQASAIDVTKLEDSMNIRKNKGSLKKKQHAATFSRQNTKSVHNARMGFLNKLKLKKMNTVAVVGGGGGSGGGGGGGGGGHVGEIKSNDDIDLADNYKQNARTYETTHLQQKCLVTVELLDPQTHTIIMQNPVSRRRTGLFFFKWYMMCVCTCGTCTHLFSVFCCSFFLFFSCACRPFQTCLIMYCPTTPSVKCWP